MVNRLTGKKRSGLVLILAMLLANPAGAAEKLRFATEGAYPPFNMIDSAGNLGGFEVDLAKALCHEIKAECEIVAQDWDGLIPALMARKYDVIMASMSITDERRKNVAFTEKYYETPVRFIAKKGTLRDISPEGLKGKVIGAQVATISANFLQDVYADHIETRFYDTQEQANLDLLAGRVDALIADALVLDSTILKSDKGKDYQFVGPALTGRNWAGFGDGIGMALRKEDRALVERLNAAIREIRANGVYTTIRKKYFDFDIYGD